MIEENEPDLTKKKRNQFCSASLWQKHKKLYQAAKALQKEIGTAVFTDFNKVKKEVDDIVKAQDVKLKPTDKKTILNAVSWYDADAEKVIKKVEKLSGDKLESVLQHLDCQEEDLADFGYFPADKEGKYIIYETESDLRDYENVPLKDNIHDYFKREVKPHMAEAWIDLDKTKIGYEISFNKYFYQHQALRSIEEVTQDILELEKKSEGLINEIVNLD